MDTSTFPPGCGLLMLARRPAAFPMSICDMLLVALLAIFSVLMVATEVVRFFLEVVP